MTDDEIIEKVLVGLEDAVNGPIPEEPREALAVYLRDAMKKHSIVTMDDMIPHLNAAIFNTTSTKH